MSIPPNGIFAVPNESDSTVPDMRKAQARETLASLIQKAIAGGQTYEGMANASGGRISPNYIHDLGAGKPTDRLGATLIYGLAKALGVPHGYVLDLALGLSSETQHAEHHQMIDDFFTMSEKDQDALRVYLDNLTSEVYKRTRPN